MHILDGTARADMLDQLALLAGEGDEAVCVGPPPPHRLRLPMVSGHRPFGSARLAGWRLRYRAEACDVIHAWSLEAMRAAAELALAVGKPMVLSLACAADREDVRAVRRIVGPGLFHVTVPTDSDCAALGRARLPAGAVWVLPPAAEAVPDRPATRRRVRESLGIGESTHVVAAPDPMIRHAGQHIASWAHAIVRQVVQDVCLLLPGGGPLADHVRSFATTTGYNSQVLFPGERLSPHEVLAAADSAAFFHERAIGVAGVAAAMVAGLPVVASRLPDVAELAPDGEASLLAEPGDPRAAAAVLLKLLEDRGLADRLAGTARRRAERLCAPESCRGRLDEVYAAAAAEKVY